MTWVVGILFGWFWGSFLLALWMKGRDTRTWSGPYQDSPASACSQDSHLSQDSPRQALSSQHAPCYENPNPLVNGLVFITAVESVQEPRT